MMALRAMFRRLTAGTVFILLIALFVLIVFWNRIVLSVPSGSVGVMWYLFFGGTQLNSAESEEGLHLIFPWDKLYIYDTRLKSRDEDYTVISRDGLQFRLTLTFRWWVNPNKAATLHKYYGPDYENTLLVPEVGSRTREIVSRYDVGVLVSDRRGIVGKEVYDRLVSLDLYNGIGGETDSGKVDDVVWLQDVLIREIELPPQIQRAIQNKLEQAQVVEEYAQRVKREQLESERKVIEAEGVRRFQEIVTPTISDGYLKWRGIEATMELSKSPNSKVVIIGSGEGGLPIILDGLNSYSSDGQNNNVQGTSPVARGPNGSR